MSGTEQAPPEEPDVDPDESPFEMPPIEGIPFKRGSVEDQAIKRILERARRAESRTEP